MRLLKIEHSEACLQNSALFLALSNSSRALRALRESLCLFRNLSWAALARFRLFFATSLSPSSSWVVTSNEVILLYDIYIFSHVGTKKTSVQFAKLTLNCSNVETILIGWLFHKSFDCILLQYLYVYCGRFGKQKSDFSSQEQFWLSKAANMETTTFWCTIWIIRPISLISSFVRGQSNLNSQKAS